MAAIETNMTRDLGATAISQALPKLMGFEVTQRILVEQTLGKIYNMPKAAFPLAMRRFSAQLMPTFVWKLLSSLDRSSIVEVNCGYGFLSNYISLLFPAAHVTGIDARADRIKCARNSISGRTNLEFLSGELNQLAKIDADLIIVHADVLNDETKAQLKRLYEWLTPGGDLLLCTPGEKQRWWQYAALLSPQRLLQWLRRDPWLNVPASEAQTTMQWQRRIEQAGFHCLAEYDASQDDSMGLPEKLVALFQPTIWYHAEKPLFESKSFQQKRLRSLSLEPSAAQALMAERPTRTAHRETAATQRRSIQQELLAREAAFSHATSTESDDVLGYIFSKPWSCLSQEI